MTWQAVTDEMLAQVAATLAFRECEPGVAADASDLPTYVTDADGVLVYANAACETFAGRTPVPGLDRWCVTWKLYTDTGDFLPHDQCPMAVAIREEKPIRGASAVAERPDGTRAPFRPFPTPFFGRDGQLSGAVNVLVPIQA